MVPEFCPSSLVAQLRTEAIGLWQAGNFKPAGTGRGNRFELDDSVRSDWIHWLDPINASNTQLLYFKQMEQLRLELNRSLYLGLFDLESHLAVYNPGDHYHRHLDQFQDSNLRILSCILYLNENWQNDDGGQLLLYDHWQSPTPCQEFLPTGGNLLCFLSARYPHEVLPAKRPRFSLTGWYRTRNPLPAG